MPGTVLQLMGFFNQWLPLFLPLLLTMHSALLLEPGLSSASIKLAKMDLS
jgi:hypothetical protein